MSNFFRALLAACVALLPLVHAQAKRVADRITAQDPAQRITALYALLFARPATTAEITAATGYLDALRTKLKSTGTSNDRVDAHWLDS